MIPPRHQGACIHEAPTDYNHPEKGMLRVSRVSTVGQTCCSQPQEAFKGSDANVMVECCG